MACWLASADCQRHVNELVVPQADEDVGLSGHCRVGRIASQPFAKQAVVGVGRATANEITRVEVPDIDW